MDLCGHDVPLPGSEDAVFATGAEFSSTLASAVQAVDTKPLPLLMARNEHIGDMSDHHAFRLWGVPFLFLSCGWWEHYHKPTDTLDRLNVGKIARFTESLIGLIRQLDGQAVSKSPPRDFLKIEAESFRRLTGMYISPDDQTLQEAARRIIGRLH